MADTQPSSFFVRAVSGTWRVFDLSFKLVVMLAFFSLLAIALAAMLGSRPKALKDQTSLIIDPRGPIVEAYSQDPSAQALSRALGDAAEETRLRDLLNVLELAAKDAKISNVLLQLDSFGGAGMSTIEELRAAITAFKASGKPVYAYASAYGQAQYLIASAADKIFMDPEGLVLIEGLGSYRNYYKNTFERFGVDVYLFRVGTYKSAAETYVRADMSPEDREARSYYLGSLWAEVLDMIASSRKLGVEAVDAYIQRYHEVLIANGGDGAKAAVAAGLVDELMTRKQLRELLISVGAKDDDDKHTFRQVRMAAYLERKAPELAAATLGKDQVGIVVAQGPIVDGEPGPDSVGGETVSRLIRKAREDEDIKALVLRVDSPGGGVYPSELIRREIELTREAGKPVVVSMGDVAASGGYWISMNANKVLANQTTITGSIGIFGLLFKLPQAADRAVSVKSDGVGTTPWIGALDLLQPLPESAGQAIQAMIDQGYREFTGKVAEARGKTVEEIDRVAQGRVWSGAQALERGLVDELGGLDRAVELAAELANLKEYAAVYRENELDGWAKFLADLGGAAIRSTNLKIEIGGVDLRQQLIERALGDDLDLMRAQLERGSPLKLYAHCLCD